MVVLRTGAAEDDDVDLVGSSWGALVALEWTVAKPGRVRHLSLVDIEPSFSRPETDVAPRPPAFADAAEVLAFERGRK